MSTESTALYLGIDGGGSKTAAVIVDATGQVRGRGVAGSSNHEAVGVKQAIAAIHSAAHAAISAAHAEPPVAAAWLGLAGIDHPQNVVTLMPFVRSLAGSVRLTNDAELVLGALPHEVGVALIAGTGSIAMGRNADGRLMRTGGWGHVLGDEGSGYAIGREALQHAARAADHRGADTALLAGILRAWRLATPDALFDRVYQTFDKTDIAALAPLVFELAEQGDRMARRVIFHAASELALAALTVARGLCLPKGTLPLALGGGLLVHQQRLRKLVVRQLARTWTVEPNVVTDPALSAARALLKEGIV